MFSFLLRQFGLAVFGVFILGGVALPAESELDRDVTQAPRFIVKKLDPRTKTITTYGIPSLDAALQPQNLNKLSKDDQKSRLDTFFAQLETSGAKLGEEKAETVQSTSELDHEASTAAHWRRWRGCYSGGVFGASFYVHFGRARFFYRPHWGYGGFYGGGYYGYNPCGYGPGCGVNPGYGNRPGYPVNPGYGNGPGDPVDPGYGNPPNYPNDPGYGQGYGPGYGNYPNYPVDPGYNVNRGYGYGPGYANGYGYTGAGYSDPSYTLYGFER